MNKDLNQPKVRQPIIGEKVYVPTSLYISRGEDDFEGGIATIDKLYPEKNLSKDNYNYLMVGIKERPDTNYNWRYLLDNQEKWKVEYAGKIAHPDPDINTPWIQEGDTVNGKPYHGPDVW